MEVKIEINSYQYEEIDGKDLRIKVHRDEDGLIILGQDSDGKFYSLLHEPNYEEVSTNEPGRFKVVTSDLIGHAGDLLMKQIGTNIVNGNGKEYAYDEIIGLYREIERQIGFLIGDVNGLDGDSLKKMGFKKFDKNDNLYLIPIWAFDMIPDGNKLESINGRTAIKGFDEIDMDVRFGCLAWGIRV